MAFIWTVKTIENLHQCGFASSVFTQQCMNFALAHIKIHVIASKDTWKTFDDSIHVQMFDCPLASRQKG